MEYQIDTRLSFAQFLETEFESAKAQSITDYAARSLMALLRQESADELTENLLMQWMGTMLLKGAKPSTTLRYWRKLHALYQDWMEEEDNDPFAECRGIVDNLQKTEDDDAVRNLSLLPRLFNKNEAAPEYHLISIFFVLLYNPTLSLLDIPNMTFENVERVCPQIEDIIDAQDSSFGRKYVFPMRQGKASAAVIYRGLTGGIGKLLTAAGFRFYGDFTRDSITAIWIAAALKIGVSYEDIRAIVHTIPREYSSLSLIEKSELSDADRQRIICDVANSINDNTQRWFVMKLRPGVKLDDVKERIDHLLPGRLKTMQLFYPTRTLRRKEGKRTIKEEVPYLPDLLFFKTQQIKLKSLFAAIGDLAWCFRRYKSADAPYSVIPNAQMTQFQRAIGQFTPDISLSLTRLTTPLPPGRRVRITGGLFAGYEGEILDEVPGETNHPLVTSSSFGGKDATAPIRTFYLRLTTTDIASWQVAIPDLFIEGIQ